MDTGIARDLPAFAQKIYGALTVSVEKGAQSSIFLACAPEAAGLHGQFIMNCKPAWHSPLAKPATAAKLWQVSEELVAGY